MNAELILVLALAGLSASIWFSWLSWLGGIVFVNAGVPLMIAFDNLSLVGIVIFAVSSGLSMLSAYNYAVEFKLPWGELLSLMLFAVFGAGIMASGTNLIVIFIGLEILSVSAYVMAGLNKNDSASQEASIKYFLLGAVASAIFLLGIAFFYGATGALDISYFASQVSDPLMFYLAVGLIVTGLGFKAAVVPFQWWTPDVYQGAPIPATTFFATTVKAAAFVVFFRLIGSFGLVQNVNLSELLAGIAILTMTIGNLSALFQDNIKRMLAYSSIAHAGYILLAFLFIKQDPDIARASMFFYLIAYIIMTGGAFSVLSFLSYGKERTEMADVHGLGRRRPLLAMLFSLFLLSLAGFPPTAGFFAKFFIFKSAIQHGYVTIVVIALLNSMASVYYYMRPVVSMYFSESKHLSREYVENVNYATIGVIIFSAIAILALGLFPSTILLILQR